MTKNLHDGDVMSDKGKDNLLTRSGCLDTVRRREGKAGLFTACDCQVIYRIYTRHNYL